MSDTAVVADSAPVPDVAGAPIAEVGANFSQPLGSQIPPDAVAKPDATPEPKSIDDSIDRAIAKSAAQAKEPKVEAKAKEPAKVEAKPEQPRDNGKFVSAKPAEAAPVVAKPAVEAPKPSHTADDAPARFTETAKAKWASADPEIRGEVQRMHRELTEGYQKHKAGAERDATIAEFHEMAQKSGTDVKTALTRYTALEGLLRKDLVGGLEEICSNVGVSLKDVAAHVMGQTPEQDSSKADATIRELKQELAGLKEQVGGVTQTIQQQQKDATLTEIEKFATRPEHARFEELADDIAFFMQSGRAKDLTEAYTLAERLNPAPAQAEVEVPAASSAAPDLPVHPDKGQKSINGAPSADLTRLPGKKRVALSIDESLNKAFGHAG